MLLFLLSLLLIGLYLLWREHQSGIRRFQEFADKVPGPAPLPILGNALEFGLTSKSMFEYLLKRVPKEYGDVSRVWIGQKLMFILADPVSIEFVFTKNDKNMSRGSLCKLVKRLYGEGLIVSDGEIWKRHRRIIAPTFRGQVLAQFVDIFNSTTDVLMSQLLKYQNGPDFDISPLMNLYALDIICETAMGVKVNAMLQSESDYVTAINGLEEILYVRIFRPWLHSDAIFSWTSLARQQAKYLPIVNGMMKQVIEERKKTRAAEVAANEGALMQNGDTVGYEKKKAFLDYLLHYVENGEQLTHQEVQDEVHNIMAAGHDTTAVTLSFTCWLLAKHPHIQEKAVAELRTVFGNSLRNAALQDLSKMKYLEQILKESLRLFPAIPLFGRQLTEDVDTGKYIFPGGCDISINAYMLHRHPDYFPEPEKFDPDRFLPENCVGRHPYCYIPFGGGPRTCLGYKYAFYEMKIALAQILRQFKILPAQNPFQDLDLTLKVVLKSLNGVRIRLEPRNFTSGQ